MITVFVFSFSYKRGLPKDLGEDGGGYVFDCRSLPNPFWEVALREYNGKDEPIADFFERYADAVESFMKPVRELVMGSITAYAQDGRNRLSVGFGCTGGKHRSVYCAERLAAFLRGVTGVEVALEHKAL